MAWMAWKKRPFVKDIAWTEVPRPVAWLLIGWFVAVYGLYFLYEWTSTPQMRNMHYMVLDRFYLPGLFPLAVIAALVLARMPKKLALGGAAALVILGAGLFVTWANSDNKMGGPQQRPGINGPSGPVPSGQPPPGQLPSLQGPQPQLSPQSIDQVRQEVKSSPTTAVNVYLRLDVLRIWRSRLAAEDNRVQQAVPVSRFEAIAESLRRGDLDKACRQVDEAYRVLEALVTPGK